MKELNFKINALAKFSEEGKLLEFKFQDNEAQKAFHLVRNSDEGYLRRDINGGANSNGSGGYRPITIEQAYELTLKQFDFRYSKEPEKTKLDIIIGDKEPESYTGKNLAEGVFKAAQLIANNEKFLNAEVILSPKNHEAEVLQVVFNKDGTLQGFDRRFLDKDGNFKEEFETANKRDGGDFLWRSRDDFSKTRAYFKENKIVGKIDSILKSGTLDKVIITDYLDEKDNTKDLILNKENIGAAIELLEEKLKKAREISMFGPDYPDPNIRQANKISHLNIENGFSKN